MKPTKGDLEKAEGCWYKAMKQWQNHDGYVGIIAQALASARAEALDDAKIACDWRLITPCTDPMHDDRWCARCEAMKDACDLVEQQIEKLKHSLTGEEGK